MDTIATYDSAFRDFHSNSFPVVNEKGEFRLSNGQRMILDNPKYQEIRLLSEKTENLKRQYNFQVKNTLKKRALLEFSENKETKNILDVEEKIKLKEAEIEVLREDINKEEKRLIVRGQCSEKFSYDKSSDVVKEQFKNNSVIASSKNWLKKIRTPLVAFGFIVVLETFFGLAQFEFLSEYKSNLSIFLRIAASALIIITLHIAAHKSRLEHKNIYKAYIVFGGIMLVLMLFGSLLINFFEAGTISSQEINGGWDLSNLNDQSGIIPSKPTWLAFFNKFDFIPGILSLIIFLVIYLLTENTTRPESEIVNTFKDQKTNDNTQNLSFNHIMYLKDLQRNKENELSNLYNKINKLELSVSKKLSQFADKLDQDVSQIKNLVNTAMENTIRIEFLLRDVMTQLQLYETDFQNIYQDTSSSKDSNLPWPILEDIKTYYNL